MKQTSFQEKIVSLSRTVILSSITIFALYSVSAWAGPASTPPIGNVSGPITTGNSLLGPNSPMQTRYGSLVVSGNLGLTGSLILSNGAGAGKVLTSDANGIASWGASSNWVNVPLTDTSAFDINCMYRGNLTTETATGLPANSHLNRKFYFSGVSSQVIILNAHSSITSHVNYDSKSVYRINGLPSFTMSWLEKKCN